MIRITIEQEERYSIPTVAKAIGESENSIYGYFSNRKTSVKNGITLIQIYECLKYIKGHRRDNGNNVKWEQVPKIREGLRFLGAKLDEIAD